MRLSSEDRAAEPTNALPVEAAFESEAGRLAGVWGRTIIVPVRFERVMVEKRPFVYEQAVIKRGVKHDQVRVEEDIRRERLQVDAGGNLGEETLRLDVDRGRAERA